MVFCQQVNFIISPRIGITIAIILFIASCTVPHRYQKDKPFVYKSGVTLKSDLTNTAKQQLKSGLMNQIDDSLQVRTILAIRLKPPFFYYRLSKPPVFDSLYIGRSKTFMTALLNSQGYFGPTITDTFSIDTVGSQKRVSVRFNVTTGKALRLDSIGFALRTPELQLLTMESRDKSLLKKNDAYSIQNISSELERLLNIFRDNGYYKISKEDLYAEQDTVVAALIDPELDPFEQLELLDSLQKKRLQPTITVVIKQRVPKDSAHLSKYYLGDIKVFPDRFLVADTTKPDYDSSTIDGYHFFTQSNRFKLPFIARNIFLKQGTLYKQSDYYKTINTFTNLGAWQQVDINLNERFDSTRILDADILLSPGKKQSVNIDFETSRNATDALTTGSLFGIGLNLGLRNRNTFRESIQSSSNIRFGVELGSNIVQTAQVSFSHNIAVPRFILPFRHDFEKKWTSPKTLINFNTAYTDRRKYVQVRSVNTSWGYGASRKNHTWQYIPFNIEYTTVDKSDSFKRDEINFPTLALAFNTGLIISQIISYTTGKVYGRNEKIFRASFEESGAIFGMLKNLERGDLNRFLKLDLEYRHLIKKSKSAWAFRAFGGYGFVYGKMGNEKETNLPFFKAYFGGGPYSMRAWQVRQLGLGSSKVFEDTARRSPDRFGDMKLEGNVEYRFNLATIAGIKVKSAFFVDMGNIWGKAVDRYMNKLDSTEFKLGRLYKDLAVSGGTSLRFDFDFFLIRLDWAYKLKDPIYADDRSGWLHNLKLSSGQFQLGIGYPF